MAFHAAGGVRGFQERRANVADRAYAEDYRRKLDQRQLITPEGIKRHLSTWKWLAYAVILGLGGYKGFVAVMNGHFNVIGLILIAIAGVIAVALFGKLPWLTRLGKLYLVRLQNVFEGLKYQAVRENTAPQKTTMGGFDPLLLSVGVFGSAVLVGTAYGAHDEAFARQQQAGSSGGACGACGSGGSSCSSSGSSSCSSGCSGGCGGCS